MKIFKQAMMQVLGTIPKYDVIAVKKLSRVFDAKIDGTYARVERLTHMPISATTQARELISPDFKRLSIFQISLR